ncbi:MAG: hypothetical protein GXO58_05320 [Thermodesulfobacteria bacterium]|nr:hypothetical protein [Thermodesulfobacteriota bacterium]
MGLDSGRLKNQPVWVRYGVAVIVVILWYVFILSPIKSKMESRKMALEGQELKIERLKRRIKKLSNIDKELAQEKKRFQLLQKRLIPGRTLQEVATNLQNSFLKNAKKAEVEVLVYRSGSPRKWRDYKLAVAIFSIKCSLSQFLDLLELLDKEKKFQRINNINVSTIRGKKSELRINMEIEGLFLGDKAKL